MKWKKIHNNIAHSLIKPCARNGFANCLSNLVICTIGRPIVQPIIQINNIFICSNGLPVHSTLSVLLIGLNGYTNHLSNVFISMISESIAQPVVQINNIFIRSNSPQSVQHYLFYSSVQMADQTIQIIYSPIQIVRQNA